MICPCDYRDSDVKEYGACYCALYVRKDVFEGKTKVSSILERRPLEKQTRAYGTALKTPEKPSAKTAAFAKESSEVKLKLWYCKQCGHVVFREEPPYICPICKAKREMFVEIKMHIDLSE